MSTAGNWSRTVRPDVPPLCRGDKGFTLIELTVVMAIVSIVFIFSIPRLRNDILTDQTQKTSRWLLANVRSLKERSFREKKDYILHIDIDGNAMWTSERPLEAETEGDTLAKAAQGRYQLPDNLRILDVEFPGDVQIATGVAEVLFYAKGYSETAFIHMEDDEDRRLSFLIEPFLPECRYYEHYAEFESR